MFRDREGEDCKGIHKALCIRAGYRGLERRGGGEYSESSGQLFKVGASEINENKQHTGERRCFFCKRLEYHWTFLSCSFFSITSIAAYGVSPHIKSVSAVTGQDRPRPRFPAGPKRAKIKFVLNLNNPFIRTEEC